MNKHPRIALSTRHRICLLALVIIPIVGWVGVLDNFSTQYLRDSLAGAGLIYGTARGINALVSLLQGTELNLMVMTFSIGEVLDPLNDLIERFSEVVMFALGSLALQAILLKLVSHTVFNVLLTILALGTGLALLMNNQRFYPVLARGFIITAFLRFSLGLVVIANGWVDIAFLNSDDNERHQNMTQFQVELREINSMASSSDSPTGLVKQTQIKIADKKSEQAAIKDSLLEIQLDLRLAEETLDELRQQNRFCAYLISSTTCPAAVLAAKDEVDRLEVVERKLESAVLSVQNDIDEMQASMACVEKQSRGESCGKMGAMLDSISPEALRQKLANLEGSMGAFADNTINLLMSLLLKSVIIPLLFFYLLLKLARTSWSRL